MTFVSFSICLNEELLSRGPRAWSLRTPKIPWRGGGNSTRRLPGDLCDISIGLSRIRLDNICVQLLDQWRRVITAQIEEKSEPKQVKLEKPKTALDIKSENPLILFAKTENQMLINGTYVNRNETPKPRKRSCLAQKPKNQSIKQLKKRNRKSQCLPQQVHIGPGLFYHNSCTAQCKVLTCFKSARLKN